MIVRTLFIGLSGIVCLAAWRGSCCPETGGEAGSTTTTTEQTGGGGTGGQAGSTGGQGASTSTGGRGNTGGTGGVGGQGGTGGLTRMTPTLTVIGASNGGPGCPVAGSVEVTPLPSGDGLSLQLPDVSVQHAQGTGYAHTSCVTGITVRGVEGMQFAATGARLQGRASLPADTTAGIEATTFFAGNPTASTLSLDYTGPHDGPIDLQREADSNALVASPCGKDAIFNVQVSLSLDMMDPATGNVSISNAAIPIAWNACSR